MTGLRQDTTNLKPPVQFYQRAQNNRTELMEAFILPEHLKRKNRGVKKLNLESRMYAKSLGNHNDNAGLILPREFGGSGTDYRNIFPQYPAFNQFNWANSIEDFMTKAVKNHKGIRFTVYLKYNNAADTRSYELVYCIRKLTNNEVIQIGNISNPVFPSKQKQVEAPQTKLTSPINDTTNLTPPVKFYQRAQNNRTEIMEAFILPEHLKRKNRGKDLNVESRMYAKSLSNYNDNAGLILPKKFGGSGTDFRNIFPQYAAFEQFNWANSIEDSLTKAVKNHRGVRFTVTLKYNTTKDTRPYELEYCIKNLSNDEVVEIGNVLNPIFPSKPKQQVEPGTKPTTSKPKKTTTSSSSDFGRHSHHRHHHHQHHNLGHHGF